ncbi:hypothetical protein Sjap_022364 [Stephania japonica]|uniref:OCRE domain-containing protein n=1 Tax=Stephania japonica TaxID=461633 RepID=A0AAP0HTM1_9MAGN
MEEDQPSRSRLKRPFFEDDDSAKQPSQKKVRFPKKKKAAKERVQEVVRAGAGGDEEEEAGRVCWRISRRGANRKEGRRANQLHNEALGLLLYCLDDTNFVEDGIQIEPFNLDQEREEGYFDAEGNFVEYVSEKEIKDAWLDNLEIDPSLAKRNSDGVKTEEEIEDLSSDDIGKIKRRIANALEPAETVLQALKRLKGTSKDKKDRMSEETKLTFDQLTEDAMKLMDNGEYNVYEDKKEVFEREAEGYERLACARDGSSSAAVSGISAESADTVDMFAEDDEIPHPNTSSNGNDLGPGPSDESSLPSSDNLNIESGDLQNDYVFDETSGYYYSSSSGYYYDPTSGLYCSASSGTWYSYNEQTNAYEEVKEANPETQEAT